MIQEYKRYKFKIIISKMDNSYKDYMCKFELIKHTDYYQLRNFKRNFY